MILVYYLNLSPEIQCLLQNSYLVWWKRKENKREKMKSRKPRACLTTFLKIDLKKQFLRIVCKSNFQLFSKKIYLETEILKFVLSTYSPWKYFILIYNSKVLKLFFIFLTIFNYFQKKLCLETQIWKTLFSTYSPWKYFILVYISKVLILFSIFLIVTQNTQQKNHWKHLKCVLENNLFLQQIFKKPFSVKSLSNIFSKLENCFLF